MKRTACECRLNNIVLNNPVGFWSAPVGLLLELGWVLACGYLEQKRGRGGYCGTKHRPSCLLCLANAQQIKSGRNVGGTTGE